MDKVQFRAAYNESRRNTNRLTRHKLIRYFQYSDGVKACADAGCYWLLNIIARELSPVLHSTKKYSSTLEIDVDNKTASMKLITNADTPPLWTKRIKFTDLPKGKWLFGITGKGPHFSMSLLTEYD